MEDVKAAWPSPNSEESAPDWYKHEVFRNALRRVVAVLNSACAAAGIDLSASDQQIAAAFQHKQLDKQLIQYNIETPDPEANSDEFSAEYHFYANVSFVVRKGLKVAVFKVPQPFIDWGYQNLQKPADDALVATDFPDGATSSDYVMHCATNYLVKNFWHNFVHHEVQGITNANYGAFRGLAREDSDFQADHIANILTLLSYGVSPGFRGQGTVDKADRINAVFTRNRCNRVFAKRARHREDDMAAASDDERWAEHEWRFCRGVANRVSTTLLANHLAAPSLKVLLGGEARHSEKERKRWRKGNVLVEVADRRIATTLPAYVPDDDWRAYHTKVQVKTRRQGEIRRFRAERERQIAEAVRAAFLNQIKTDQNFRDRMELELRALGTRIGAKIV